MSGRRHVLSDDTLSKNRRIEQILPGDMMFPQAGFFRVPGKALNKKGGAVLAAPEGREKNLSKKITKN